ncbi:Nn.00g075820.m01.CDS01 [Neocucurbitaria sp. VM-36]
MGPKGSNAGSDSSAFPPDAQSKAKISKRKAKRDSRQKLQFVTVTDPSQFKDENAKRSVRSQAMIDYRSKSSDKGKKPSVETLEPPDDASVERGLAISETTRSLVLPERLAYVAPDTAASHLPQAHSEDHQYLYPSTSAAWWGVNPSSSRVVDAEDLVDYEPQHRSRYDSAYSGTSSTASSKVIKYEDSDSHEDLQMRLLVGKLATSYRIGDGVDPFIVLPQFQNPQLNSLYLMRKCMRAFASDSTIMKWLPAMLSHPHIILSSTLLASTWLDMHAGKSGDSNRTALVKHETIGMIKERLADPDTELQDATLMVILHLLAGEMWSCNERTLRLHVSGVATFIAQRGGMHEFENGVVGEIAAAFCDTESEPIFHDWEPPNYPLPDDTAPIPESPLFCPRKDFTTIVNDAHCSRTTLDLLRDMRDLTNLFLTHPTKLDIISDIDVGETKCLSLPVTVDRKVNGIRERLSSLPSAYTPGLPTSNDWVYEACRLTALIYTASIIMLVPFSVAADPSQNQILFESRALTNSQAGGHLQTTRLTEALYEVLELTDTSNIWDNMPGVLYWVCAVGAAAARTPTAINMIPQTRFRNEAYTVWIRRCLIMFSTRTMILLVFQHPLPVLLAQKRLLKVQELIRGAARRLPS